MSNDVDRRCDWSDSIDECLYSVRAIPPQGGVLDVQRGSDFLPPSKRQLMAPVVDEFLATVVTTM